MGGYVIISNAEIHSASYTELSPQPVLSSGDRVAHLVLLEESNIKLLMLNSVSKKKFGTLTTGQTVDTTTFIEGGITLPKVFYEASNFGPSWGSKLQSNKHTLDCTWAQLIWAAITVGKRGIFDIYRYREHSLYEIIMRVSMLSASLKQDSSNYLIRTEIYRHLDPSEKNALSYFQGLITSKLLAAELLDTTWLMHLDVYNQDYGITLSGERPDFIGRNSRREWIILEAKGRSNAFSNEAQQKAKVQTRKLRKIDGTFPVLRVAVQSYFSSSGVFKSKITDPTEFDKDAIDIEIDDKKFIKYYYAPILTLLEEKGSLKSVDNVSYWVAEIKEFNLKIGLAVSKYNLLMHNEPGFFELEEEKNSVDSRNEENIFIGDDSILIITGEGWGKENMSMEPAKRI